jgi:hypothetical protein
MTIVTVTKIVTDQKLSQKLSQKVFNDRDSMTRDKCQIVIEGLISCSDYWLPEIAFNPTVSCGSPRGDSSVRPL